MATYYDLSTTKYSSAQQRSYSKYLVALVREVADERGWKFHDSLDDKVLLYRIQSYYGYHIQNAKKRLQKMLRNPSKPANAQHLCAHLDLIEQRHGNDESDKEEEEHGTWI